MPIEHFHDDDLTVTLCSEESCRKELTPDEAAAPTHDKRPRCDACFVSGAFRRTSDHLQVASAHVAAARARAS
jgi:hypothetical protein